MASGRFSRAWTTTTGAGAAVTDNGANVVSTVPLGTGSASCGQKDYDFYAGTSMATPHVAGVAALLTTASAPTKGKGGKGRTKTRR